MNALLSYDFHSIFDTLFPVFPLAKQPCLWYFNKSVFIPLSADFRFRKPYVVNGVAKLGSFSKIPKENFILFSLSSPPISSTNSCVFSGCKYRHLFPFSKPCKRFFLIIFHCAVSCSEYQSVIHHGILKFSLLRSKTHRFPKETSANPALW